MAHAYMYAQRTADGRIALGGRGVPYRFGSRTDNDGTTQPATVEALREILVRFFPALAGLRIEHAWSGVLGVPRDWCATVTWTARRASAGRRLRRLRRRHRQPRRPYPVRPGPARLGPGRTHRPHRPALGEPPGAPLGAGAAALARVRGMYAVYREADRREQATHRADSSRLARIADRVAGRG